MKRKIVTVIVAAMMITSMTACNQTADSASAKESIPDTEESVVIDTETEELETEEPTELVEATEEIEETEVMESTEDEQLAEAEEKAQETSKNGITSNSTSNTATQSNSAESNSTGSTSNSSTVTTTPETPAASTPAPADTTATATTPATTTSEHEHVWVEHLATGHYEEQVVTAAYDEPVYEARVVCGCGETFQTVEDWMVHQDNTDCMYGYSVKTVQTGTIHHDAVTQTVWVEDAAGWYDCSICGERSAMASHNHN